MISYESLRLRSQIVILARLYPSGCIASRLAQAGKQRARDFDYMLVEMGCEEIRGVPELLAYQRNGVGKGWLRFAVPSGLANGEFSRTRQAMSQQSNDGEQAEQHRCGAGNRQAGPLALCLYSQMSPDFLEGHLYLPAPAAIRS